MATLLLRGQPIGSIHGVLVAKDGTRSHSEPPLLDLVERRLEAAPETTRPLPSRSRWLLLRQVKADPNPNPTLAIALPRS